MGLTNLIERRRGALNGETRRFLVSLELVSQKFLPYKGLHDKQNDKAHLSRSSITLRPKTAALTPAVTQAKRTSAFLL